MTTESKPRLKITYATLRADNEELHALYEAGLTEAKRQLDGHHRNFIGGSERVGDGEATVTSRGARARMSATRSTPPARPSRAGPRRRGANGWRSSARRPN